MRLYIRINTLKFTKKHNRSKKKSQSSETNQKILKPQFNINLSSKMLLLVCNFKQRKQIN